MKLRASLVLASMMGILGGCTALSASQEGGEPPSEEVGHHQEDDSEVVVLASGHEDAEMEEQLDEGTFDRGAEILGPDRDGSEVYGLICVSCHGKSGDGRGLEIQLFSFGAPEEEWSNEPTVDGILRTLEDGIHDSSMRAFPEYRDVDRVKLAEYVLELREALRQEEN